MKNLRRTCLLLFSFLILEYSHSQNLPNGGSSIAGFVCKEGQVYVWGLNKQGPSAGIVGTLGTGSALQNIPSPQQVVFPSGITIKQLAKLSGNFFLAIDCNDKVWGWGGNSSGQLGTGNSTPQIASQRVLVQAGSSVDLAGFRDSNGQLRNISKVYAGNSTSLALTDDGRLLSWGCNGISCDPAGVSLLGNNTTTDALYPTFVIDGSTGQPLGNVIDMAIGDHLAMALVNIANDGTSIGTVYTWGSGATGSLGRNATGTGNSGNEISASNVARPARFISPAQGPGGDGYLSNIVMIAAGDVAGYALDAQGYVWAWGNGGWSGLTGQGTTVTHSDPRRVVRGAVVSGAGQDGTFLIGSSIFAGEGFAGALTSDGRPVAWGNNGCSVNPSGPAANPNFACGGSLGNGTSMHSAAPVFIQYGTDQIHNDVIDISRGDFWGYYMRSDNSVWVWGDNIVGQLGIGGYVTKSRAVEFTGIPGCTKPDPAPKATIYPRDTTVCRSSLALSTVTLRSVLNTSTSGDNYEYTWYRVADYNSPISAADTSLINQLKKGTGSQFQSYTTQLTGRYWLKARYLGNNVQCGGYLISYDKIVIDSFPDTSGKCTVTGFDVNADNDETVSVFPNPSTDAFTIMTTEPLFLTVSDINGKEIERIQAANAMQIGKEWPAGVYFLSLKGKNKTKSFKLNKF